VKRKQRRNAERRRSIETRASVGLHHRIIHRAFVSSRARVRPRRSRAFLVMLSLPLRRRFSDARSTHFRAIAFGSRRSRSGPGAGVWRWGREFPIGRDSTTKWIVALRVGRHFRVPPRRRSAAGGKGTSGRVRFSRGLSRSFSRGEEDRRLLERSEPTGAPPSVVARAIARGDVLGGGINLSIPSWWRPRPSAW